DQRDRVGEARLHEEKGAEEREEGKKTGPVRYISEEMVRKLAGLNKGEPLERIRTLRLQMPRNSAKIKRIEKLDGLEKLEELDLSYNAIRQVENVARLGNLRRLNLAENQIVGVKNNCLEWLGNLEQLNLSGNQIEVIPVSLGKLQKLKVLRLARNRIALPKEFLKIQPLQLLSSLTVMGNPVAGTDNFVDFLVHSIRTLDILDGQAVSLAMRQSAKERFESDEMTMLRQRLREQERRLATLREEHDKQRFHLEDALLQRSKLEARVGQLEHEKSQTGQESAARAQLLDGKARFATQMLNEVSDIKQQLLFARIDGSNTPWPRVVNAPSPVPLRLVDNEPKGDLVHRLRVFKEEVTKVSVNETQLLERAKRLHEALETARKELRLAEEERAHLQALIRQSRESVQTECDLGRERVSAEEEDRLLGRLSDLSLRLKQKTHKLHQQLKAKKRLLSESTSLSLEQREVAAAEVSLLSSALGKQQIKYAQTVESLGRHLHGDGGAVREEFQLADAALEKATQDQRRSLDELDVLLQRLAAKLRDSQQSHFDLAQAAQHLRNVADDHDPKVLSSLDAIYNSLVATIECPKGVRMGLFSPEELDVQHVASPAQPRAPAEGLPRQETQSNAPPSGGLHENHDATRLEALKTFMQRTIDSLNEELEAYKTATQDHERQAAIWAEERVALEEEARRKSSQADEAVNALRVAKEEHVKSLETSKEEAQRRVGALEDELAKAQEANRIATQQAAVEHGKLEQSELDLATSKAEKETLRRRVLMLEEQCESMKRDQAAKTDAIVTLEQGIKQMETKGLVLRRIMDRCMRTLSNSVGPAPASWEDASTKLQQDLQAIMDSFEAGEDERRVFDEVFEAVNSWGERVHVLQSETRQLESKVQKAEAKQVELARIEQTLVEVHRQIGDAETRAESAATRAGEEEIRLQTARGNLNEIEAQVAAASSKLREVERKASEKERSVERIQVLQSELRAEEERLRSIQAQTEAAMSKKRVVVVESSALEESCRQAQDAKRKVEEEIRALQQVANDLRQETRMRQDEAAKAKETCDAAYKELSVINEEVTQSAAKRSQEALRMRTQLKQIDELESRKAALSTEVQDLERQVTELGTKRRTEEVHVETLLGKRAEASEQLAENERRLEAEPLLVSVEQARRELAQLETEKLVAQQQLDLIHTSAAVRDEAAQDSANVTPVVGVLDNLKDIYKQGLQQVQLAFMERERRLVEALKHAKAETEEQRRRFENQLEALHSSLAERGNQRLLNVAQDLRENIDRLNAESEESFRAKDMKQALVEKDARILFLSGEVGALQKELRLKEDEWRKRHDQLHRLVEEANARQVQQQQRLSRHRRVDSTPSRLPAAEQQDPYLGRSPPLDDPLGHQEHQSVADLAEALGPEAEGKRVVFTGWKRVRAKNAHIHMNEDGNVDISLVQSQRSHALTQPFPFPANIRVSTQPQQAPALSAPAPEPVKLADKATGRMQRDEAYLGMMSGVLAVATALRGEGLERGVRALFADKAAKGPDDVRRVTSQAFLKLAFETRITPQLATGMQVLQCVESCLPQETSRADRAGLVFDNFVECLARLGIEVFAGVDTNQIAELLMLQMDQDTHCLTRHGALFERPRIGRSKTSERVAARLHPQASTDTNSSSRQALSRAQSPMTSPLTSPRSSGNTLPLSPPQECVSSPKTPTPEKKPKVDPMEGFVARMEKDLNQRKEKLERLRQAQSQANSGVSKNLEELMPALERLYRSRALHEERSKEKVRQLTQYDQKTGQKLFCPEINKSMVCTPKRSQSDNAEPRRVPVSSTSKGTDRFQQLFAMAQAQQANRDHITKKDIEHYKEQAEETKVSAKSKSVHEDRMLRQMVDEFLARMTQPEKCLSTQKFLSETLERLIGMASLSAPAKEGMFQRRLLELLDPNKVGFITLESFHQFAVAVSKMDVRAKTIPNSYEDILRRFRQRYVAHQEFAEFNKAPEPTEVPFSFSPKICKKSRALDAQRRRARLLEQTESQAGHSEAVSREEELLQHAVTKEQVLERKRRERANKELAECTFKPDIRGNCDNTPSAASQSQA
ncbi:Centriolin (Centrosomal protein 1) (Centrosomal protein of 110 kDa) (Cep110), partial [Durusdinium trenchii]